jgi:iron complex outermembrane receptor protein
MNSLHTPARTLALGLALSLSFSVLHAQPVAALTEVVVVTATRAPQTPGALAAGVTLIDAAAIEAMGASSVNEAIRWLAGVPGRTSTAGGSDPTLDLRGFGETADSNVVILVDGVRQNEGDSSGTSLSWLPIESVRRIEILRGSAAVLYGEGATGGVIHVLTDGRQELPRARAQLGVGSDRLRQAKALVSGAAQQWRWQLSASALDGDFHRENFDRSERSGAARIDWRGQGISLTSRLALASSKGGLPGGLTPAEAAAMPSKSFKPFDRGQSDSSNLLLAAQFDVADWRAAFDWSRRRSDTSSNFVSDGYRSEVGITAMRQGLQAWRDYSALGTLLRTQFGLDAQSWDSDRDSKANWGDSQARIRQRSQALFVRQEAAWSEGVWRASAGLRRTLAERSVTGAQAGRIEPDNNSWELGMVRALPGRGEVYGRLSTSFRLPNADEFSCYVGFGSCTPTAVSLLRPQTSGDLEFGWRQSDRRGSRALRVYRSDLRDEIGLDATQFNNINYDPTRRQGLESEFKWKPDRASELGAVLNLRSARFTQGPYAGRAVPMVSAQTLTLSASRKLGGQHTLGWMTQLQSSQRVAGDLGNTCADRIAGFGVSRARYAYAEGDWEWAVTINNVLDKSYYNFRTRCSAVARSVYPEVGRSWLLTGQRLF